MKAVVVRIPTATESLSAGTESPSDQTLVRQVLAFFALTLGVSWLLWTPIAFHSQLGVTIPAVLAGPAVIVGGFGPAIAAVLTTWRGDGSVRRLVASVVDWRHQPTWYVVALVTMPALVPVGTAIYAAVGGVVDVSIPGPRLATYPVNFLFVLVSGGSQEELGWRGFALPRLQSAYGGTVASLLIGAVWAVWHLPLFAIPASSQYGQAFLPYAASVFGFSILLTWLYNGTGGSVLLAMLFHASLNASTTLYPIPVEQLQRTGFPDTAMLGIGAAVGLVALVVLLRDGRTLNPRQDDVEMSVPSRS
jgi:membrane protease YdiL (CAAX protease family)